MTRYLCSLLIAMLLAGAAAVPAGAVNKLEGYYEIESSLQRDNKIWRFGPPGDNGMPRHYLELKWLSWPSDDLEMFFKLRAQSNRDDNLTQVPEFARPEFLGAEGHLRLHGERWETFLFARQNRFWVHGEPLLQLVDQNKLKNDNWGPQASGIRSDFWDLSIGPVHHLNGTFIYSDDGGTYNWTGETDATVPNGTDSWVSRLQKNAFTDRLKVGAMFLRKDWTNTSVGREWVDKSYNNVFSADISFYPRNIVSSGLSLGPLNLENTSWIVEGALSDDPYQIATSEVRGEDNRFAFAAEMRNLRVSDLIIHAWYHNVGENFRDYLSYRWDESREFNRRLYHVEGIYLVPHKAVTATVAYDHYEKRIVDEEGGDLRPTSNLYSELYIEFIDGFKGKLAYNRWHGFDASGEVFDFFTYPNWYADLSVENRLVKVRIQARIRDWQTFREIYAYGYDMEFNATGRLKGYFRLLNVNEKTEARSTLFAQIRYDIGYGAECFFEYGAPWDSEYLVRTESFVTEGSSTRINHLFKAFLKIYF